MRLELDERLLGYIQVSFLRQGTSWVTASFYDSLELVQL